MREILHAFAMVAIIAVAALCTLVQLSDVNRAFDRLGQDEASIIQQVSNGSGDGPAHPGRHAGR